MTPYSVKFQTEEGSLYLRFADGRWMRKRFDNEDFKNTVYLGSINLRDSIAYNHSQKEISRETLDQELLEGNVSGFVPEFIVGNRPFGITLHEDSHIDRLVGKIASTLRIQRASELPSYDEKENRIILPRKKFREIIKGRDLDYHVGDRMITEVL